MQPSSEYQRLFLAAVCKHFHEIGAWPTCGTIDKVLRHHRDLDIEEVIQALDTFMHDSTHVPYSGWNPEQMLVMNVSGLYRCQSEEIYPDIAQELTAFMAIVRLSIERYENGQEEILVTSDEMYDRAGALNSSVVDNAFELVQVESFYSQANVPPSKTGSWSFKVPNSIRKYRNVKTLEDYLAVRHELNARQGPKLVYTGSSAGVHQSRWMKGLLPGYMVIDSTDTEQAGTMGEIRGAADGASAPAEVSHPETTGNAIVPLELVNNTRGYIEKVARQVNKTYEAECYDACAVILRRLIETLIIEVFETRGIADRIKSSDKTYLQFGALINKTLAEKSLGVGRNLTKELPRLKKITDKSAHDRRYNARRSDIDSIRDDARGIVEELINLARWTS